MGEQTRIEWCDATFNPWIGCTKISAGCANCYALDLMETRYKRVKWGPQGTRKRTSDANWRKPLAWNRQAERDGVRRKVFCASLADVFEDRAELIEWRADLFDLIQETVHLDWLLLTKRPENVNRMIDAIVRDPKRNYTDLDFMTCGLLPPNVWIGTSVENQAAADERIPHLLRVPARVRFLSCEPLLGPVRLDDGDHSWLTCNGNGGEECCEAYAVGGAHYHGIDWVIVGGESGHHARPAHPNWFRAIRDACQAAGTPYFHKQNGEWIGGYSDLPHDLAERVNVGDVPEAQGMMPDGHPFAMMYRFGKKAAGRLLDGREWNEFPTTEPA